MGEEKISKLAFKLSIPMIISMISMAIYNIVDTIFVSGIGENALTAVSLSFPIQVIISAIGLGSGIGINSLLAKMLGKKDEKTSKNIIFTSLLSGIICFLLVILIFNKNVLIKFFKLFTSNKEILNLGYNYLRIIVIFSFTTIFSNIFNKILEAYGKAKLSMISQFIGIITNIILDPLLIYGANGCFSFGIKGAAYATIIGSAFGMIFSLLSIICLKDIYKPKLNECYINFKLFTKIYKVGLPSIILESVAPITTIVLNNILIKFSEDAVTLYGLYYKTQSFIFMIISGLNYGMIPIVAFNYGANKKERVLEAIKLFSKISFTVTAIGTLIFAVFAKNILGIFNVSENILMIGEIAFRILCIGFIFAGQCFIISSVFQALGNGKESLIIFLIRKVIVPFLFIYFSIDILGLNAVWISFTLAEIIAFIIAEVMYKNKKKKDLNINIS